jgi:hypothetical protein
MGHITASHFKPRLPSRDLLTTMPRHFTSCLVSPSLLENPLSFLPAAISRFLASASSLPSDVTCRPSGDTLTIPTTPRQLTG